MGILAIRKRLIGAPVPVFEAARLSARSNTREAFERGFMITIIDLIGLRITGP